MLNKYQAKKEIEILYSKIDLFDYFYYVVILFAIKILERFMY